jgi:undecaprenyl diphosphate synthase
VVEESVRQGIGVLTLFAFSSENWRRPASEVNVLMELFISALRGEVGRLNENGVQLRVIGERRAFPERLQRGIAAAEEATCKNQVLVLQVAANYGGRWDITEAARRVSQEVASGRLDPGSVDEDSLGAHLSSAGLPDPDLFIRTGGEQRLSNFLLWQSAYAELYFSDLMWPDFGAQAYADAIAEFGRRQRRFGLTGEQVVAGLVADSA